MRQTNSTAPDQDRAWGQWSNHSTWQVALLFSNDPKMYDDLDQARTEGVTAQRFQELWTRHGGAALLHHTTDHKEVIDWELLAQEFGCDE